MRHSFIARVSAAVVLLTNIALAQSIQLTVDLSDAPRNIFHSRLTIAAKPGPLTLVYPKWIPGNHRPSGPIANLTGLKITAGGQTIDWQRDPIDMYAFHLQVPAGAKELQVSFDTITSGDSAGATGAAASANVLDLNWNQVVLYPQRANSDAVEFAASVHLPSGLKFGTAMPIKSQSDEMVEFNSVSLTQLVDSPLIAGDHYRQIGLNQPGELPVHVIDMVSESEAALAMTPLQLAAYHSLVAEAGALFGARHYTKYHFLYTLSNEVGHHGLEHHESSDNSVAERTLIDPELRLMEAGLLPHEFVHSWNGKYRRPAGLATANYQEPMIGDLLWVYEGLTEYLGNLLTARSKLWTPDQYREALAETAAVLDHRAGRTWRPLEDTARSVQSLRLLGPHWQSWRRSLDYYPEGELIWLEVDTLIRQQTHGQKSLDDFCRLFHGGQSGTPKVIPYTFDDVVKTLNQVAPYDWEKLLKQRVNATGSHAPLDGIEQGGWRLVYNQNPNVLVDAEEKQGKYLNAFYSLGFAVRESGGELEDVMPGSPAYDAGIGPGMKLVAVNGRRWSKHVLRDALRASLEKEQRFDLLVENAEFFKTYSITYSGGEKYPHLLRAEGPDLLSNILSPLVK
ncbi:MAG TPA: M61 family peptidase [Terriglobales bacterium]|nr:M61 family peptidase [Terriglobales bacterium]